MIDFFDLLPYIFYGYLYLFFNKFHREERDQS